MMIMPSGLYKDLKEVME